MTALSYDEDEHDEGSKGVIEETAEPSTSALNEYRSTISKEGVPTTVALKGGVRGGHSVATMSASHPKPLGMSPGDYLSDGRPSTSLHSMVSPQHWPKGLTNVGNTCYANAALQCLLSTSLSGALLDPKTMPTLRRYSSNPNLLAKGSGSVDSSDDDYDDDDSHADCGLSIDNDLDEEEDGIFLDSKGIALSKSFTPTAEGDSMEIAKGFQKKLSAKARKTKKEKKRLKKEDAAKRKEREQRRMEETCKWLTTELTSIAQEYCEDSSTSLRQSPVSGASLTGGSSSIVGWLSSSYNQTFGRGQPTETHGVVNPGSITRHPNRLSKCLMPYQQEDAHEFMRALISNLVMNGHNRQLSSLFDGLLESSVTCQVCGRASQKRDRYMDLSVDINDPTITTLDDALFEFTKDEFLTEDNAVHCQRCRKKQPVTKGLRLATAPSILVVHLKRFAFNDYGRLVRLHKRIQFPQKLEIGDYMSNLNKARPPPYSLVGVLVHQGQTCASGHYLSFVKKNGEWFKTNDSEVTVVNESTVMMQQAYILMYEVAGMREKTFLKPKTLRKEASILSTVQSWDEATLAKDDFSMGGGGTHWSHSDRSISKRTSSMPQADKGTFNNPYGSDHPVSPKPKNVTATESLLQALKRSGVTRLINDICCDSVALGLDEPDLHNLNDKIDDNFNYNHAMLLRNSGKYAHECESVDTQDSFIRRQSLLSNDKPNPIQVLEVQHKRKPNKNARSRTAPRQRGEHFHTIEKYTPRGESSSHSRGMGSEDGVVYRKFATKEVRAYDTESISSRSTLRSRDRHSFSTTRFSISTSKNEDLPLPPRAGGKQRNSSIHRRRTKSSRK